MEATVFNGREVFSCFQVCLQGRHCHFKGRVLESCRGTGLQYLIFSRMVLSGESGALQDHGYGSNSNLSANRVTRLKHDRMMAECDATKGTTHLSCCCGLLAVAFVLCVFLLLVFPAQAYDLDCSCHTCGWRNGGVIFFLCHYCEV